MYWWYKDVFVERYSQAELEHQTNLRRTKTRPRMKYIVQMKRYLAGIIKRQNKKLIIRQSAQSMSRLTDLQLADIGLTQIDLHLMTKGLQPTSHHKARDINLKPQALELVSVNNLASKQIQATANNTYQKAA